MLRSFSNQVLTPDDVSVPCRIRRCNDMEEKETTDEREETTISKDETAFQNEPEEMTCTMRKWHMTRRSAEFSSQQREASSKGKVNDAELILTPLHKRRCMSGEIQDAASLTTNSSIPLSKRFASFGGAAPIPLSKRFASFGGPVDFNENSDSQEEVRLQFEEEITIPLDDIHTVRTNNQSDGKQKTRRGKSSTNDSLQRTIHIETSSFGAYALIMESTNEQLVLVTFLRVNSTNSNIRFVTNKIADKNRMDGRNSQTPDNPTGDRTQKATKETQVHVVNEKLKSSSTTSIEPNPSNLTQTTTQTDGARSIDVETLAARGMSERLKRESLTEKVERRVHRLMSSLGELSGSLTKCTCGCFGESSLNEPIIQDEKAVLSSSPRARRNTASTVSSASDENLTASVLRAASSERTKDPVEPRMKMVERKELLQQAKLPSGLSVESDWDDELSERSATFPSGANFPVRVLASDI